MICMGSNDCYFDRLNQLRFREILGEDIIHDFLEPRLNGVCEGQELQRDAAVALANDFGLVRDIQYFIAEFEFDGDVLFVVHTEQTVIARNQQAAMAPVLNRVHFTVDDGDALVPRAAGMFTLAFDWRFFALAHEGANDFVKHALSIHKCIYVNSYTYILTKIRPKSKWHKKMHRFLKKLLLLYEYIPIIM